MALQVGRARRKAQQSWNKITPSRTPTRQESRHHRLYSSRLVSQERAHVLVQQHIQSPQMSTPRAQAEHLSCSRLTEYTTWRGSTRLPAHITPLWPVPSPREPGHTLTHHATSHTAPWAQVSGAMGAAAATPLKPAAIHLDAAGICSHTPIGRRMKERSVGGEEGRQTCERFYAKGGSAPTPLRARSQKAGV